MSDTQPNKSVDLSEETESAAADAASVDAPAVDAPAFDAPVVDAPRVSFGLSGSLQDIQSNTQFVSASPVNVKVWPAIEDAPSRLGAFGARISSASIVLLAVGVLVGGAIGGATATALFSANNHSSMGITINNPESISWATGAAAKASQSVVTISVDGSGSSGIGSGVILSADGYILTNTHVVTLEGATTSASIQVKFSDGRIVAARLVGTDPTNDLAVVKVDAAGLQPATFADSSKLNVGDAVLAIGAPLGLDATVTKGIISTLNRTIDEASSAPNAAASGATIHMSVIQTDAAINPGNSGGALVDSNGDVIGINVAIATASATSLGGQAGSIGVGFAIPANVAQRIADDIMANGKATHGLLGAQIYNNAKANAVDAFSNGAKVDSLTAGGPGETAGLKKGDVITMLNDSKVTTASDLTALVRQQPAGATVKLTILRGTSTISITVVLGNADSVK